MSVKNDPIGIVRLLYRHEVKYYTPTRENHTGEALDVSLEE